MKICLFSPYVPKHLGGGEKYLFDVAAILLKLHHQVFLAVASAKKLTEVEKQQIRLKYQAFISQDLTELQITEAPLFESKSGWQKLLWTAQFEVLYYQTDGSLFFSLARKNILHLQIPFTSPKNHWVDRLKLLNWPTKNANSEFTRQVVSKAWKTPIQFVHYPMIQPLLQPSEIAVCLQAKQPIILNVGRFFRQLHCKHQEILVQSFTRLCQQFPQVLRGWKLVCIGTVEDEAYATEIKALAKHFPVEFIHDASREKLMTYYKKASIYWHATGFGENPRKNPEKMEHFGISTVEAMSAGAAPVVIGQGGQLEILRDLPAWSWQTQAELEAKTLTLIKNQPQLRTVQLQAIKAAKYYSPERFAETLKKMLA
ncbi:MAG TPA: hypothetical protein DEP87_00105 [Candidatus Pacebacteria bacterium]|nr:hypothetical protein [Candidatus Paceibacterota bacterium]